MILRGIIQSGRWPRLSVNKILKQMLQANYRAVKYHTSTRCESNILWPKLIRKSIFILNKVKISHFNFTLKIQPKLWSFPTQTLQFQRLNLQSPNTDRKYKVDKETTKALHLTYGYFQRSSRIYHSRFMTQLFIPIRSTKYDIDTLSCGRPEGVCCDMRLQYSISNHTACRNKPAYYLTVNQAAEQLH